MDVVVSPWLRTAELQSAHIEATARTEGLDLSFLPAVAPEWIRSASGALDADLSASGTLARLIPHGRIRLDGGRIASREYGEWTRIAVDGEVSEDGFELRHLEAHRGEGSLLARVSLRGVHGETGQLDGKIEARSVDVSRAGMDLATVTFTTTLKGTYQDHHLEVRVDLPSALIKLPDKLPRQLQGLDPRPDITIGKTKPKKPAPPVMGERPRLVRYTVHLVCPGNALLQRDNPRVRLELRADATYELEGNSDYMTGSVEVVRGTVEPLSDRRFEVKRGRVNFTGGPPKAAMLDIEAYWENTTADVTVTVSGPLNKPDIRMRSSPALDEGQIAMLIASGQIDLRAGRGASVGSSSAASQADPNRAAAQKLGFAVFNSFIRDQLPFTTGDLSLDASAARVSWYIPGTKIYVGYTRHFDAIRELGENEDEVRLEYAITPHWTLQGTWGSANTGGASLMWSRDY
jgi:translocation and assembly module TamB